MILYKPETLTLEHKRVPFDSHYPPEQKKTVEEVEETGVEAMQRDFSIHADNARFQALPTYTITMIVSQSRGTWE